MVMTAPFDAVRYVAPVEPREEPLNDALASGNIQYVSQARGKIARA